MQAKLEQAVQDLWYRPQLPLWMRLLKPLSFAFSSVMAIRRYCYQINLFAKHEFSVPVIVVGNITAGGTGKTPMVAYLVDLLQRHGYKPGIVSRGYRAKTKAKVSIVTESRHPHDVGDETLLLHCITQAPVVIARDRVKGVVRLLSDFAVDVVIADDGLQHYALDRQIELAMIDGERQLGNGLCHPLGPLRESPKRLEQVALVVNNGEHQHEWIENLSVPNYQMELQPQALKPCIPFYHQDHQSSPPEKGGTIHAIAGIGNPDRFFNVLEGLGYNIIEHRYPDHANYKQEDISFSDQYPIIMTEKDAVKIKLLLPFLSPEQRKRFWILPVRAYLGDAFDTKILSLLSEIKNG